MARTAQSPLYAIARASSTAVLNINFGPADRSIDRPSFLFSLATA